MLTEFSQNAVSAPILAGQTRPIVESYLFPLIVGAVVLAIWLFDKIPRDWRYALGGLMLLLLVADSVIAGLHALIQ